MDRERQSRKMDWVGREIVPHEADVRRWLKRRVSGDDVDDIIQESYARIAALDDIVHIQNGRAYFFTTARALLLEQIRRAKIVRMEAMSDIDWERLCQDEPSPERIAAGRHDLAMVRALMGQLPARCRRIFELRKMHGLPQREVAQMLNVTEHIVENDMAKGLRLLLAAVAAGVRAEGKGPIERENGAESRESR